jgi:hypothetical protein
LARIPYPTCGGSEPSEGCRSEATAPGSLSLKKSDSLISCHEEVRLFNETVLGSIIHDLQTDVPNA